MSARRRGGAALATAAGLGLLASTGCVSFTGEFGTRIDGEQLARIVDGETTRDQVIAWFGPPSAFFNPTFLDVILEHEADVLAPAPVLNDVFTYRYIRNNTRAFFVPLAFAVVRAGAMAETLTIFFDDQGRVRYHAFRRDATGPGSD